MVMDYLYSFFKIVGVLNDVFCCVNGCFFILIWLFFFNYNDECEKFFEMFLDKECLRIYKYRLFKYNYIMEIL